MSTGLPRCVAVIGAGAAGALTAVRLLQHADSSGLPLEVRLIDPAASNGHGRAYGTEDPGHLLNVPAGRMSAFAEDPDHFVRWLASNAPGPADRDAYVPRMLYGRYLSELLDGAAGHGRTARLTRLRDRVTGVAHEASRLSLGLASGADSRVDAAVLALGSFAPGCAWLPEALLTSPHFVRDPWAPGALDVVPPDADVLLVGTGLTMADVALTLQREQRVVHAVSRHGLLPQVHATGPLPASPAPQLCGRDGLPPLRRAVLRHLAASRRLHGDWRSGLDSLRPLTAALWQQLPLPDRARFLEEDLRVWEVHRHRLPPRSASRLDEARRAGRLRIGAAEVTGASATGTGVRVRLSDGRVLDVGAVLNCTGPRTDLATVDDPLIRDLLRSGLARTGPLGLGFDATANGRLRPADGHGHPQPALWTLGALRRGQLLETTAIPETRAQADDVARSVVELLSSGARGHVPAQGVMFPHRFQPTRELVHQALEQHRVG